jgi:hypothetical protein
MEDDIVS